MSQVTEDTLFSADGFESYIASRSEPDWLTEKRRAAWADFEAGNWPTQKDEEWIRTDIRLFHLDRFTLAPKPGHDVRLSDSLLGEGVELGGHLVSCDGHAISS